MSKGPFRDGGDVISFGAFLAFIWFLSLFACWESDSPWPFVATFFLGPPAVVVVTVFSAALIGEKIIWRNVGLLALSVAILIFGGLYTIPLVAAILYFFYRRPS